VTTAQRGYGYRHQRERARWAVRVNRGTEICARCFLAILPGEAWHLDHDSYDRTRYLGPSHEKCNCGEPGKRRRRRITINPLGVSRKW
jgi:hypothetical protein